MLDQLRELYQETILDHGRHPRNFGHHPQANRQGRGHNPLCGDQVVVYLKVNDQEVIEQVSFVGRGCVISIASASIMTEQLRGKHVDQARKLFAYLHATCTGRSVPDDSSVDTDASERLRILSGVRQYPIRVKCATLPWHAMISALDGSADIDLSDADSVRL